MDSCRDKLAPLEPPVSWLGETDAFAAFRRVWLCFDESRHGLSKSGFDQIDRLDVDAPSAVSREWLAERIGRGSELVLVVYMRDEVCEVPVRLFLDHWQTHFCPAGDDIAVLPPQRGWILCYFHEDQFEFVRGGPAEVFAVADRSRE
jgi:hypothetical protein